MERTMQQLKSMQAAPLNVKVLLTKQRIREWVNEFGTDGVYVSFSGGKDSTVLLTIAREIYPDIKAVFVDTGLEYPEIRDFVRTWDNVEWIHPKITFKQVIEKYGYPFISKQVSKRLQEWRNTVQKGKDITNTCAYREFTGSSYYVMSDGDKLKKSLFSKEKWLFMTKSPYKFSHMCCDVMKKDCFKTLGDSYPMTGQMAQESLNRKKVWLQHGCNAFDAKIPVSNPMAFWTEQDVLQYIYRFGIKIAAVYGDVVVDGETEAIPCQLTLGDINPEWAKFNPDAPKLKTTGCRRTGCMFCGYGCHLEKPGEGRFERMKKTHPKQYEWIMKDWDAGGLGYKRVIDWLNENGNLHIRY